MDGVRTKPAKPYTDFPLFAHASHKWAKKIDGKMRYFGSWDDPDGALAEYAAALPLTLERLCEGFITAKLAALSQHEIGQSTFADYRRTCEWLMKFFGRHTNVSHMQPSKFSKYRSHLALRRSLLSLGNEIARVKIVFKWGFDSSLLEQPVRYGPDFRRPSARSRRRQENGKPRKLFTPSQIHQLLDEAGLHLRAMIMLGINCGFGPTDCAELPLEAIGDEWIDFPRPKTGIERRCPLWPETAEELRRVIRRRTPLAAPQAFVQASGRLYTQDVISKRFGRILRASALTRGGFYWLRHTFETIGGDSRDQVAVDLIMGHADNSMAGQYRHGVDDQRLRDVVDHVRTWLELPE